jgi:hypothetical protein
VTDTRQDVQKQVVLMLSSQDIATLKLNVFLRVRAGLDSF